MPDFGDYFEHVQSGRRGLASSANFRRTHCVLLRPSGVYGALTATCVAVRMQ
ncbi:hypothetical protein DPMN_162913 [Dreissena polymorpha]|uniref:Uncharacterized protein n=1 Tax=Dreissena polymorpha TaxID=45954 RepID=A0A9D4ER59_DREPO|nr:hypothetical protein DPMN_162913 [Dreissena polymorpha]